MDAADLVNLHELDTLARERLEPQIYDYVVGGAGDEHTLGWNVARWADLRLAPRALVDVGTMDTSLTLLGRSLTHPILLAPAAAHGLYHPDGELATLAGAAAAEALYVQSTLGTTVVEDVGAQARRTGSDWWFQLYVQRDRGFTAALLNRAEEAGASAHVLTVDTPVLGARDRDRRLGLPQVTYPNLTGLAEEAELTAPARRVYLPRLDPTLTWTALEELCSTARCPVVVKGVLRGDDAQRAVEAGAGAVIVSNHGGRNLDTTPATADALPRVVEAVGQRVPVLVDGGIRRGTDIAKARMLGAAAVLVGRPYLWGLSVFGAAGVARIVEMLRTELEMAMGLLGAPTLADLTADLLWDR